MFPHGPSNPQADKPPRLKQVDQSHLNKSCCIKESNFPNWQPCDLLLLSPSVFVDTRRCYTPLHLVGICRSGISKAKIGRRHASCPQMTMIETRASKLAEKRDENTRRKALCRFLNEEVRPSDKNPPYGVTTTGTVVLQQRAIP